MGLSVSGTARFLLRRFRALVEFSFDSRQVGSPMRFAVWIVFDGVYELVNLSVEVVDLMQYCCFWSHRQPRTSMCVGTMMAQDHVLDAEFEFPRE